MKAIDLFCGCGGLSSGLRDAGFNILAGVDIEKDYIKTFTHNFKDAESICADISKISSDDLMLRFGLKKGELDLLAGGPPCQGFSKNVPRSQRVIDSDNNQLVNVFLTHCENILPKFIIMENVAEMRNGFEQHYTEQIVKRLSDVGYDVIHGVHNAADYGVPQNRRRAFFIARRDDGKLMYPTETHAKYSGRSHVTVWDAISDLRSLSSGSGVEIDSYITEPQNEFQEYVRNGSKGVFNHIAKKLSKIQMDRLSSLKPGEGIKNLPDHLRPKGGYSGAYGRLTKDMIMPTITRWVFHPGSGRFGHPVDSRVISIREAARLHSFNDNFIFVGTYTQQAGQLGNSVPPLLAKKIAESLLIDAG
jgi:DNA (cytosine-5)-methyltransferase 1